MNEACSRMQSGLGPLSPRKQAIHERNDRLAPALGALAPERAP